MTQSKPPGDGPGGSSVSPTQDQRNAGGRHTADDLSPADTKMGRLQRALLERLKVHEREGTLPTSLRFLFYELEQLGVVSKDQPGTRTAGQDLSRALIPLRESGRVPWHWITDETRELTEWRTAPTVADYVADAAQHASIDRWDGLPAPLILCESRSLSGVLRQTAARYTCPIASTNGQCRGFLVSVVAPALEPGQRVLYLGDWDWCGAQIEDHTKRAITERTGVDNPWERIALTEQQIREHDLPVISKPDRRYKPVRHYDAVETEALGQARIVAVVRARLDELMPEPIGDVLDRQRRQRGDVAAQLREMGGP